jgi:hypothetical protein
MDFGNAKALLMAGVDIFDNQLKTNHFLTHSPHSHCYYPPLTQAPSPAYPSPSPHFRTGLRGVQN